MSDFQYTIEEQNKMATRLVGSILGILILKWILIIGLNRWAKSFK